MLQGTVIDLDIELSLNAANLGIQHKIPIADSIILATGIAHEATIWTQDADFEGCHKLNILIKIKVAEGMFPPQRIRHCVFQYGVKL